MNYQLNFTMKHHQLIPVALLFFLAFSSSCTGQSTDTKASAEVTPGGIQWMGFEEAVAKSEKAPKKLFIDVYTDWCGWCKKMDKTTFSEPDVAKYINDHFYPVKLNAETKDSIIFRDKVFKYIPDYKANELAISLLSGKMGYPSYVLLDESFAMMTPPVQSYLTKENLMPIITFFGDDIYKTKSWEEYEKESKP